MKMDELEENILTRFVIVEKHISIKYLTPRFNIFGEKISPYSSFFQGFSSRIFISPGIYTIERDTTEFDSELLSNIISEHNIISEQNTILCYDLVASPAFNCFLCEEKTSSLFKEKNGKYRDTS